MILAIVASAWLASCYIAALHGHAHIAIGCVIGATSCVIGDALIERRRQAHKIACNRFRDYQLALSELKGAVDDLEDVRTTFCSPIYVALMRCRHAHKLFSQLEPKS
jgi:hypothetical protein